MIVEPDEFLERLTLRQDDRTQHEKQDEDSGPWPHPTLAREVESHLRDNPFIGLNWIRIVIALPTQRPSVQRRTLFTPSLHHFVSQTFTRLFALIDMSVR